MISSLFRGLLSFFCRPVLQSSSEQIPYVNFDPDLFAQWSQTAQNHRSESSLHKAGFFLTFCVTLSAAAAGAMAESSRILIQGGKVVNEDCSVIGDVYIENGKIVDVGPNLQIPAGVRVINATDKLVIPGGIDTHTHMELAFMGTKAVDDFHVGTKVQ